MKYYVKGTEERLLFGFKDLLVSVGGFLGLFIGLSLTDVVSVLVDTIVLPFRNMEGKIIK